MPDGGASSLEIFVVEDEEPTEFARLSKPFFSLAGFNVTYFADGVSLLAEIHAKSPACIILDVHIPGMSGLDILKELNAEGYPAPIFIMSGRGDIPMAVDAIKNGAHDFIEKPFRGPEVISRIRDAIEARGRRGTRSPGCLATSRAEFSGPRAAVAPRARGAGADRVGLLEQGSGPRPGDQPAHDRGASRAYHGEARRQERRRSHQDRDERRARDLGINPKTGLPCFG